MIAISDKEFRQISEYVKSKYGINLTAEKRALVEGRLQTALVEKGMGSFLDFYRYMMKDTTGEATKILMNRITTNHTYFMREGDHFEFFKLKVLPYLAAKEADKRDLRIWSAGCSSGEEAYTLQMLISDYLAEEIEFWDSRILATDISTKALDAAVNGAYTGEQVSPLPLYWRNRYFQKKDHENFTVVESIKRRIIFHKFNLMEPFPFKKKFHVIFCRNVMIYFDSLTKSELIKKFYDATEKGGFLFIGHSESLNNDTAGYQYVMPAVYRKE